MLIVAGITRSGLSVTMQMLHAGGYPCEGDAPAFEKHPMGKIPWDECRDKAVKLVDSHHHFPPQGTECDVIRLKRTYREQIKSFNKWNSVFGLRELPEDKVLRSLIRDYDIIDEWVSRHRTLLLNFEEIIRSPLQAAKKIAEFCQRHLDVAAMAAVVRKRDITCYPTLLELELLAQHEAI